MVVKVKGVSLELGDGETYVLPPLTLGVMEAMQDRLEAMTGGLDKNTVSTTVDCLHASLKRNYPDMTREKVAGELLDVSNMADVMAALMDVSGMKRKAQEAGNLAAPSTGGSSMPESSQPLDTPPT